MNSEASMSGKTCLVTGATSGIGQVTARELASQGASVVIVGRNPEKSAHTVASIRRDTGNAAVEALIGDLSRQDDVRRVADEFLARWERLDVLVNNAGAVFAKRQLSADGIEMTFALNHLAYFLLTSLVLDRVKDAAGRIVVVSSQAHHYTLGIDYENLTGPRGHAGFRAYAQSKLANILFTRELARRLENTGVTVNALHPGVVATNILGGNGVSGIFWRLLVKPFLIGPDKGAETSVYLATSPEVQGITGGYYLQKQPARVSRAAEDGEAARKLWAFSEEIVGLPTHSSQGRS